MADQGRWFKLWCSALQDPDLLNLSLEDFARWCILGCLIKVHGSDGNLRVQPPATLLQQAFRVATFEDVIACIARFPHVQIRRDGGSDDDVTMPVTVTFDNWRKYQVDSSAERMRAKRARDQRGVTIKKRREEKRREKSKERVPRTPKLTDEEWMATLKTNPAYKGIDIDSERAKCVTWFSARNQSVSRTRFLSWLNRAERPLNGHHQPAMADRDPDKFTRDGRPRIVT